jgi:ABC-type polysaccharide/polyol phosphate export permease
MGDNGQSSEKKPEKKADSKDVERAGADETTFPVGDVILGSVLVLMSGAVIVRSVQMPRPEGWGQAPGLFPLLCAVILFCMGLSLIVAAIKRRWMVAQATGKSAPGKEDSHEILRTLIVIGGILIYALILIPLLHYSIATFIYLFATIWYFWRGKLHWIFIISVSGALFLSQTFKHFFNIILP